MSDFSSNVITITIEDLLTRLESAYPTRTKTVLNKKTGIEETVILPGLADHRTWLSQQAEKHGGLDQIYFGATGIPRERFYSSLESGDRATAAALYLVMQSIYGPNLCFLRQRTELEAGFVAMLADPGFMKKMVFTFGEGNLPERCLFAHWGSGSIQSEVLERTSEGGYQTVPGTAQEYALGTSLFKDQEFETIEKRDIQSEIFIENYALLCDRFGGLPVVIAGSPGYAVEGDVATSVWEAEKWKGLLETSSVPATANAIRCCEHIFGLLHIGRVFVPNRNNKEYGSFITSFAAAPPPEGCRACGDIGGGQDQLPEPGLKPDHKEYFNKAEFDKTAFLMAIDSILVELAEHLTCTHQVEPLLATHEATATRYEALFPTVIEATPEVASEGRHGFANAEAFRTALMATSLSGKKNSAIFDEQEPIFKVAKLIRNMYKRPQLPSTAIPHFRDLWDIDMFLEESYCCPSVLSQGKKDVMDSLVALYDILVDDSDWSVHFSTSA